MTKKKFNRMDSGKKVSVVVASLRAGGAERAMVNLANGFQKENFQTDLVVIERTGEFLRNVNEKINLIDLGKKHARDSFFAFRKYLTREKPEVILVTQTHVQLMVITAVLFSGWNGILILNEQSTFSSNTRGLLQRMLTWLLFRRGDAIVVVSHGAASDFITRFPFLKEKIRVIPNPVFTEEIIRLKEEQVYHPFFEDDQTPVVLAAGRLSKEKGFLFLIRSFSELLKRTKAGLIILGDGEEKEALISEAKALNILSFVSFPGYTDNPFAYMNQSAVFVLTSVYEGLPSVLIEALACGCNIVSVDCPHGPAEILERGKFGTLVSVNDSSRFVEGILENISKEKNQVSKLERARDFSCTSVTGKYIELIKQLS